MGRRKKIKPEVVAEAVIPEVINAAVFTEYPSMEESVVKPEEKKEKEAAATSSNPMEPIEEIALKVKQEIDKLDAGLNVVYTKQFGKMIRILGNNGMHCFSRVREVSPGSFVGEFLSFIPVHHLKAITGVYASLGITNKNGTYLSTSGLV